MRKTDRWAERDRGEKWKNNEKDGKRERAIGGEN
jgi:hypothetical protein